MSTLSLHLRSLLRLGRRNRMVQEERGFTLIETITAIVILAILAAALVGLLESAIAANTLGRQRTVAQQMVQDQVEWIRQLDYATEVGIPGGNPNGIIPATKSITVRGLEATMTTDVDWVADTTPGTFATSANYKKITVRITNNRNNAVLTSVVTFVAPPGRSPTGGLSNAVINVKVQDMGYTDNTYMPGIQVNLANGPSSPLTDTTDSTGLVTFPALIPNPTTGGTAYYDISAVAPSGYYTYIDDRVPGASVHVQVAPSETKGPQVIRLYKPSTINVDLRDAGGNPYVGTATIKATSQRLGITKTLSSTATPITSFNGDPVVPGDFTLRAFTTTGGLCADPVAKYVPDAYPTVNSSTFTLQLQPCPSGSLTVNVTQLGGAAKGATVTIKDGPNDYAPITQTTNASGQTTFTNLPSGSDSYTITVTDGPGNVTASGSAVVSTGSTTNTTIALGNPPMGSINTLVQWIGDNVNGATVVVTGGPYDAYMPSGFSKTLTTSSSGQANFTSQIPAGSGYTITVTKNGISTSVTGVSVTSGGTTSRTIAMPTATLTVNTSWGGNVVTSASVSVSGGPDSTNGPYTGTTSATTGVATITVPQTTSGNPYTVTVTKNTFSASATVSSVPSSGASTTVTFTQVGTITVTATWASLAAGNATITITGGPNGGTYTGTTNAITGVAPAITVPSTTSSYPYTVAVSKNGGTDSDTVTSLATGSNANVTSALSPTKTLTLTIQAGGTTQLGKAITLSITGGPNGTAGAAPAYGGAFTTNSSTGRIVVTVPAGTGTYTVKAYVTGCSGSTNRSNGAGTSVSAASGTTSATINMTSSTCPPTLP